MKMRTHKVYHEQQEAAAAKKIRKKSENKR